MQCLHPTRISTVIDGEEKEMFVPCGHCAACRIAKKREWTIRLLHEGIYWDEKAFITLTYNEQSLPVDGGLHKADLQMFFKRLRKHLQGRRIRYFACGEYGDCFGRPHYHAIVFGVGIADREAVQQCWPYGFTKTEGVTLYRYQYVAGYVQKKLTGDYSREVYGALQPPFQLQSQGLGLRYFEDHRDTLLRDMSCRTFRGDRFGLPRYYRKKADGEYDRDLLAMDSQQERRDCLKRHGFDIRDTTPDAVVDAIYLAEGNRDGSGINRSREVAEETMLKKLQMSLERREKR